MKIRVEYDSPDSTYFRVGDAEPVVKNGEILLTEGQGSRRSWGAPQVNNTILIDECDFAAIHTGFSHKHGGGQFYRYFVQIDGEIQRMNWSALTDDERSIVLEAYKAKAPYWAKRPGKLRADYRKPSLVKEEGYKIMRMFGKGLTSLYDDTPWVLAKRNTQAARDGHQGGFYVHDEPDRIMDLWSSGKLVAPGLKRAGDYALVKCECAGTCIEYSSGKKSYTYVTPLEVVKTWTE